MKPKTHILSKFARRTTCGLSHLEVESWISVGDSTPRRDNPAGRIDDVTCVDCVTGAHARRMDNLRESTRDLAQVEVIRAAHRFATLAAENTRRRLVELGVTPDVGS